MKTVTARCFLTFAVLDLVFNPLVTTAYIQLLNIPEMGRPFLIFAALWLLKIIACGWFVAVQLRPHERCEAARGRARTDALLAAADRSLQLLPQRFGVFYGFSWSWTYALGFVLVKVLYPEFDLTPRAAYAVTLIAVAVWLGGFAFGFPIVSILTSGVSGKWSIEARLRGVSLERPAAPLQVRIGVIALALGLGPTVWMMALGYTKQLTAHQERSEVEARLVAHQAAEHIASFGEPPPIDASTDVAAQLLSVDGADPVAVDGTTSEFLSSTALTWLQNHWRAAPSGVLALSREERVVAFRRVDERRVAISVIDLSRAPLGFVLSAAAFAVVVGLWAPLCAVTLGRSISGPLERLTLSARKIVEEGKHSQMDALPVARNDEVGILSEHFNDLIEMMRDLSSAADAIASGDLRATIQRPGELPDAFRRMLEGLRSMVGEISETSVRLASAAAEIFAASQEQEAAATSQSSAMEEISRTMDSLSQSAAHVSDAVQGVLSNAEQTLANTAEMAVKIGDLSSHAGRIAEILEVIREIADRSDLLALNGSLEASRAGEGGQGFALVASEMRRLGERVTASVHDIKKLVSDIRESGSSTVMATEQSRRLAEGTTEAARQITFVTQQQRSGTEQVSQSIKNISEVVTQSVSATTQTRTSAEILKSQADRLAELTRRFEVSAAGAE